jgi:hypothetical protein
MLFQTCRVIKMALHPRESLSEVAARQQDHTSRHKNSDRGVSDTFEECWGLVGDNDR